ncbi:DgyrCDS4197 [Dimorphilus gyrociliatus]|uniref:DgyrCDS4197 n=1 Tax=Dimorphilus gyrociliatus TaxID=2664684 RepID=A0A7I8VKV2_9ANNE|nr:DgyrCDS4197 [Dimorphilus gyrociliatus]
MRVLVVYAHNEKKSFNHALLDSAIRTLEEEGHNVTVSDLYEQEFDPVISRKDFTPEYEIDRREHVNYALEYGKAWKEGRIDKKIVREQEKLDEADLVIFQFPMFWMSMPAILKGWFDRVFIENYAFGEGGKYYDTARFSGKKALISITTGGGRGWFTDHSPNGDINVILWPIQVGIIDNGILRFVGFDVLAAQVHYAVETATEKERQLILSGWTKRLKRLSEEKPIEFVSLSQYEYEDASKPIQGMRLKEKTLDQNADSGFGLTVGQHLGKPIPPNSLIYNNKVIES